MTEHAPSPTHAQRAHRTHGRHTGSFFEIGGEKTGNSCHPPVKLTRAVSENTVVRDVGEDREDREDRDSIESKAAKTERAGTAVLDGADSEVQREVNNSESLLFPCLLPSWSLVV